MKQEYIEKIYAGWYAKIIGIRLGAYVESWSYEDIRNVYGELTDYPVAYDEFASDDDSNGPMFFLRALEDKRGEVLTSRDVAEALLNYAPFEHSFFWWGGYGISTEHTAYLNLRAGIPAPKAGSIEQNGAAVAEQIGGQIFIDTWGLVNPGNPERAARMAKEAASVTHDGNGVYGGMFIAAVIAAAFEEHDIDRLLDKGLSMIPADSEYTRVVQAVRAFHAAHPENWREGFRYIKENFGYDRYPGNCHIIPNTAVIINALLYGNGDFSDTLNIANNSGWDTDCNVGNVATIMGVRNGLADMDYRRWRAPIHDFLAFSSVMGSMNSMDIPECALYIARLAYALDGEEMPEPWRTLSEGERAGSCHFEFPDSTHAMKVRIEDPSGQTEPAVRNAVLFNTDEAAHTGCRALKCTLTPVMPGEYAYVYKRTFLTSADFTDSRYDPDFSPVCYPGETVTGSCMATDPDVVLEAALYGKDIRDGRIFSSAFVPVPHGTWQTLEYRLPASDAVICELGFVFRVVKTRAFGSAAEVLVDDLYTDHRADFTVDLAREREDIWAFNHKSVTPFTRLKGLWYKADDALHLSAPDFAEVYTGDYRLKDTEVSAVLTIHTGSTAMLLSHVQGAMRSYAAALVPGGFAILKNDCGYRELQKTAFPWTPGKTYEIKLRAEGNRLTASVREDGSRDWKVITAEDGDRPYLTGAVGAGLKGPAHISLRRISVKSLE